MSYSICLSCKKPVSSYQKYCTVCETEFKQDETYWKTNSYDVLKEPARSQELDKDREKEWTFSNG